LLFFSDKNIDQIFCTNFKRTSETAQPTAKQEGIEIQTYQGIVNFVDKFRRKTENKNVLIVGHQDTTPHFVNSILDQKKYKMIRASEHGKVFHLTLDKEGRLVKEQVLEVE
jgi:broad specificity phosphatase PhoE